LPFKSKRVLYPLLQLTLCAIEFSLQLVNSALTIPVPDCYFLLKTQLDPLNLAFLFSLYFVKQPNELLFLECNSFPFKLYNFKFFAVLPAQLNVLLLSVFQDSSLLLEFLVNLQNLFQVPLRSLRVGH